MSLFNFSVSRLMNAFANGNWSKFKHRRPLILTKKNQEPEDNLKIKTENLLFEILADFG